MKIAELWESGTKADWNRLLKNYWGLLPDANVVLEYHMNRLTPRDLEGLEPAGWYQFLHDKYFVWKYSAKNRLASSRKHLRLYETEGRFDELHVIKDEILATDTSDIKASIQTAKQIKGLGTAGASGLLSLIYPDEFATVDQFVVKSLAQIPAYQAKVSGMNPEHLTVNDGVLLTELIRAMADELNDRFGTAWWTPRLVEMALWAYRQ